MDEVEVEAASPPPGLVRGGLDFILRYSLLWAGASIIMSFVVLMLPRPWFGDPWGPDDPRLPACGVQCLAALFFSLVALARTRFSEEDRYKPWWRLVGKAIYQMVFYFCLSLLAMIATALTMGLGMLVAFLATPVLLILGALTHRSGGTAKDISDRRARRIAPAIIILVLLVAVAIPSVSRSPMEKRGDLVIECFGGLDAGRRGGLSLDAALAKASADWPKVKGVPSWYGFVFAIETLPGFGGECIVARPTHYRRTGFDTFVLAPDGVVWRRDLGVDLGGDPAEWDPRDGEMYWLHCR